MNLDKVPIKGKNLNSKRTYPLNKELVGYIACYVAIFENINPSEALKLVHRRLNH